ncbi:4-demethylwyosine synthase TYW1 [Candidatus Micrarchaeota archaeon]|jgi:tRNA wybutosine-synthesizing protein 1|nr:4-demethylwyosine synthase TYW1 [Candidatus Micrarchaeota archaeon]
MLKSEMMEMLDILKKQGYHIVGNHSAVKRCKWFKESMIGNGTCYKNKFYGIKSHQCVQSTCALQFCSQSCIFCWRTMTDDLGLKFNEQPSKKFVWDKPDQILDGLLKEQLRFVSGYKGNNKTKEKILKEASNPKLLTLSLAGEPTIYPNLVELILSAKKRGMIVFLVTNGTFPEALKKLAEKNALPQQLYVSFDASNREVYEKTCKPSEKKLWDKYLETLDFINSIKGKTRTVLRMTLVRNQNFCCADEYAELIKKAQPDYVEIKSFVFVGGARNPNRKLKLSDMLKMEEIKEFTKDLEKLTKYKFVDEHIPSRVTLLCRDKNVLANRKELQKL